MDNLVQKAWELYQQTAHFSAQTILTAVVWLEETYDEKPCCKIALAIALHYLLLVLRHDPAVESDIAQDYCARAARWQARACECDVVSLIRKSEN